MAFREELATNAAYLDLITRLLQRLRVADPMAGLWEAADLQWWWRRDRSSDDIGQLFWLDELGDPVAAIVFTDWDRSWACDLIHAPDESEVLFTALWDRALDRMAELKLPTVEVAARDDDTRMLDALAAAGFTPEGEVGTETWLDATHKPQVAPLPPGYRLHSRAETPNRPHHMIARNGERVAERLGECSLYDPDLDLFVEASDGEVAAYALFWADPVTRVGLIEPMRTESPHQRLGLARHLLTEGVHRLVAHDCDRLKVFYQNDNPAAQRLYLGAGFVPTFTTRIYVRQRAPKRRA
jgi:GNAT superfamily N-acetyltransferase